MADIVTSRIFADGEKNITAAKLNDIVGSSVIQPAFVSAKPSTSSIAATDNLLVLQTAGTYAKAPFQTVIDSVSAGINSDAAIWSVRLRSFNAISNPTFEVDQRNVGNTVAAANGLIMDRWSLNKSGTLVVSGAQTALVVPVVAQGTNFALTRSYFRTTLTTQETSLAAADRLWITQIVEGTQWRELQNDVTSITIAVRSSVASLSFGISLRDTAGAVSLVKLCTTSPTPQTWTWIQLSNLPLWSSGGTFSNLPGAIGYYLSICLGSGSTWMTPANDTWQNGNFVGAVGQSNFAASPVNSTFDIAFVQHEPGSVCSTPMDCPFTTNYDQCLRYFYKTYDYETLPGTASTTIGMKSFLVPSATTYAFGPFQYPKPLAKAPTVTLYNHSTGTAGSVQDGNGTNHASATTPGSGKNGFAYIGFATATAGAIQAYAHFTADTGW